MALRIESKVTTPRIGILFRGKPLARLFLSPFHSFISFGMKIRKRNLVTRCPSFKARPMLVPSVAFEDT
ncbi:hypothetical protein Csa_017508 [Cucumis sativus]|uniref:Uncharacterized protein n=1 Tax=Cucumis sativus TaxID=3659 RepID=A0A0A0L846_CUCSA|nr:hypothetical protein Csa_017508 [Cucumis sativus]